MIVGATSSICKHAYTLPAMAVCTMPFVVSILYTTSDIGKLFTL